MAILIGIKKEHAHGSYHGPEGFEGFSIDATNLTIIKEGSQIFLESYVKAARKEAEKAQKELNKLEHANGITEEEYDEKSAECHKKMHILSYHSLMIVEGILL